jgi:rubrerythrin
MMLQEAIQTAITYETRIRDLYREAAAQTADPAGQRVYRYLGDDEQRHVDYLESKMGQLIETGSIAAENLPPLPPAVELVLKKAASLRPILEGDSRKDEKRWLVKALELEIETSRFYEKMAETLEDDGRKMFARFLKIEEGHIDAVQAELDYLSKTGYWLDVKEFDME